MEKTNNFLGEHTELDLWLSGFFWVGIALILYKIFEIIKSDKVTFNSFKWRLWLNANFFSVLFGMIASLLILRIGDYVFHIAEKFGYPFIETTDFVAWMIPVTWFIQWKLEKYQKPAISINLKEEMHVHNQNCKH